MNIPPTSSNTSTHSLKTGGFKELPLNDENNTCKQKVRLYQLDPIDEKVIEAARIALENKQRQGWIYKNSWKSFKEDIRNSPYLLEEEKALCLLSQKEANELQLKHGVIGSKEDRKSYDIIKILEEKNITNDKEFVTFYNSSPPSFQNALLPLINTMFLIFSQERVILKVEEVKTIVLLGECHNEDVKKGALNLLFDLFEGSNFRNIHYGFGLKYLLDKMSAEFFKKNQLILLDIFDKLSGQLNSLLHSGKSVNHEIDPLMASLISIARAILRSNLKGLNKNTKDIFYEKLKKFYTHEHYYKRIESLSNSTNYLLVHQSLWTIQHLVRISASEHKVVESFRRVFSGLLLLKTIVGTPIKAGIKLVQQGELPDETIIPELKAAYEHGREAFGIKDIPKPWYEMLEETEFILLDSKLTEGNLQALCELTNHYDEYRKKFNRCIDEKFDNPISHQFYKLFGKEKVTQETKEFTFGFVGQLSHVAIDHQQPAVRQKALEILIEIFKKEGQDQDVCLLILTTLQNIIDSKDLAVATVKQAKTVQNELHKINQKLAQVQIFRQSKYPCLPLIPEDSLLLNAAKEKFVSQGAEPLKNPSEPIISKEEIILGLKQSYLSANTIELLVGGHTLPIDKIYTRLAIIGEIEREEKKDNMEKGKIESLEDNRIPSHETIFEAKQPIELEKLFAYEKFQKKTQKRVIILGTAGIGKSTLLHKIAYQWAEGKLWPDFQAVFWIRLRNLNGGRNFFPVRDMDYAPSDLLAKECSLSIEHSEFLIGDKILRENSLLILDGYDELPKEVWDKNNGHLHKVFEELKDLFPHILISSRPLTIPSFNEVCTFEILGFDHEGIENYITHYFSYKEQSQELIRSYLKHPLPRSLAHIPINLQIFCCLSAEDKKLFTSQQAIISLIYDHLVNWFYRRFLKERSKETIQSSAIQNEPDPCNHKEVASIHKIFQEIAWEMMKQDKLYFNTREAMQIAKKANLTLENINQIGPFHLEKEMGYFIHLTFQEFFAAIYLGNHYLEKKNKEAKALVQANKFEPRYFLVLTMTAGYLSERDNEGLQNFFNDLFSQPYDLAISYELNLLASCFEECHNPHMIKQYSGFIEIAKDYIEKVPYEKLRFELLQRKGKLLNHPEVVKVIQRLLSDPNQNKELLDALKKISAEGLPLAQEIIMAIICILNNKNNSQAKKRNSDENYVKSYACEVLAEVIKGGQKLPKEALTALIQVINDDNRYFFGKSPAVSVLIELIKMGQYAKDVLEELIQVLNNPNSSHNAKSSATSVLAKVVINGQEHANRAFDIIVDALRDLKSNSYYAASALVEVAEGGKELPNEVLNGLVEVFNGSDSNAQKYAADALITAVKKNQKLSKEILIKLIKVLGEPNRDSNNKEEYRADCKTKQCVSKILEEVAKIGQELPNDFLDELISILHDTNSDSATKLYVSKVLGEVAKRGQAFPKDPLEGLIKVIINPNGSNKIKKPFANVVAEIIKGKQKHAIEALERIIQLEKEELLCEEIYEALGEVAQMEQKNGEKALMKLIQVLKNPKSDDSTKKSVAGTLVKVVKGRKKYAGQALEELIQILNNPNSDFKTKSFAARALGTLAEMKQQLTEYALEGLTKLLNNPKSDPFAQECAAYALSEASKVGSQQLSGGALEGLFKFYNDYKNNTGSKKSISLFSVMALGEVAKMGQEHAKEAIEELIQVLYDPKNSFYTNYAATPLIQLVKEGKKHSKESSEKLIKILKDPEINNHAKESVAEALEDLPKEGQELPIEILEGLIHVLSDHESPTKAKSSAAKTLATVTKIGQKLPKEMLIQILKAHESSFAVNRHLAQFVGELAKSGQQLPREILEGLLRIFKTPESKSFFCNTAEALEVVIQGRQEYADEALEGLVQILNDPTFDADIKKLAANILEKTNKNFLTEIPNKRLPLIVKFCFFTRSALLIGNQYLQIADKRKAYLSKDRLKNSYEEIKLASPFTTWRQQLDKLGPEQNPNF